MSELKIGSYVVESELYYETLMENGITSESQLKRLDTNGDKKLTEDELQEVDIEGENAQNDQLEDLQDQMDKLEEDYEEKMLVLDKMEENAKKQRNMFMGVVGASGSEETMENYQSKIDSYNDKLHEIDEKRLTLRENYEETMEKLQDQMDDVEINGTQTFSE